MINVIIYLKENQQATELIIHLLKKKLIASASIDQNNVSYKMKEGVLIEEVYTVVTAQSKSLLLNQIINEVEEQVGASISINATPIVGLNKTFSESIQLTTLLV
jgi:uncharacterized protein involved in tolerance to divalent cations